MDVSNVPYHKLRETAPAYTIYKSGSVYKADESPYSSYEPLSNAKLCDLIDAVLGQLPDGREYEERILMKGEFPNIDAPAGNTGCIDVDKDFVTFELRGWMILANAVDKNLFELMGNRMGVRILGGRYYGNSAGQTPGVEVRGFNAVYNAKPSTPQGAYDVEIDGAKFYDWPHRAISIDSSVGTNVCRLFNFGVQAGKTGFAEGHKPSALYLKGLADSHVGGPLSHVSCPWDEVHLEQVVDVWFTEIYGANTSELGDFLAKWYVKHARRCWFIGILMDWGRAHGMRFVDDDSGYPCEGNTIVGAQVACHDTTPDDTYSGIRFEGHSRHNSVSAGYIGNKHPEIVMNCLKYAVEEVAGSSCDYNVAVGIPCGNIDTAFFNKVGAGSDFAHFVGNIV